MKDLNQLLTFTAPLGASVHHQAEQFCHQHHSPKAQQVYRRTLAVFAVQFYLGCMGIEAEPATSQSWDSVAQALMDVADLTISGIGRVECCPILPDATIMQIPPEVWSDRIGYFAVQLEPSLRTATLLGWTLFAGQGEISLCQLHSLDQFLEHLGHLQTRVPLSQWLQGIVASGWRSLEDLIGNNQPLVLSFRTDAAMSEATIRRAKLLDLGLQLGLQSLVLLVAITRETEELLGLSVQVHPAAGELYLPPNLTLQLVADMGTVLREVQSRSQDHYIQLKRSRGVPGECFEIQVVWGEVKITEAFVI